MGLDLRKVRKFVGKESDDMPAPDAVSKSDIRHWLEMMDEDRTPCHEIDWKERAAPPAMHRVWTLPPLWEPEPRKPDEPHERALRALDEAGYDGTVGLAMDQEFLRPVHVGERLSCRAKLEGVSGKEVETNLGSGYQVDLTYTLSNQNGEAVSRHRCRLLKFRKLTLSAAR
jgi:uncharacterized protein